MNEKPATSGNDRWPLLKRLFDGVLLLAPNPWRILCVNPAACTWLNASAFGLSGQGLEKLFEAGERRAAADYLDSAFNSQNVIATQIEFKIGGTVEARFFRLIFGGEALVGLIFHPGLPRRDPVTGLPDRDFLIARLVKLLAQRNDTNSPFAVLFIDVNNFKDVNDQHGHLIGDRVLREAGERIGSCLPGASHITRFGGDEFVVLLERKATTSELNTALSRIEAAAAKPISLPDGEVVLSLSIGIAIGPGEYRTPDEILAAADRAMYVAIRAK